MSKDIPQNWLEPANPEEAQIAKELHLLYAEAKMYAAMEEALLLRSLDIQQIRDALLALASEQDRKKLAERQAEVENIRQHLMKLPFHVRFKAISGSYEDRYSPALEQQPNPMTQNAYDQADRLERRFRSLLSDFPVDNSLEIEAGILPPRGLSEFEFMYTLRQKHLKGDEHAAKQN